MSRNPLMYFCVLMAVSACSSPAPDNAGQSTGSVSGTGDEGGESSGGKTSTGGSTSPEGGKPSGGKAGSGTGSTGSGGTVPANGTPATAADIEAVRPFCTDFCHKSLVKSDGEPMCPGTSMTEDACLDSCLSGSQECLQAKRREHTCDMGSSSVKCGTDDNGDPMFTWESEQCSMYAQLTNFACAAKTTGNMMSPIQVQKFVDTCEDYCTKSADIQCLSNQATMCRKQCVTGEVDCLKAKLAQYTCELEKSEPVCAVSEVDSNEYPSWTNPACADQVADMEDACPFEVRLPKLE